MTDQRPPPGGSGHALRSRATEGLATAWERIDWRQPFPRLALCHVLSISGETLVAVSLAGSFFFKVDPAEGREKVILGLLFTMAPFALVGPFIGPFVDRVRGGPRAVIQATMALRVLVAVGMTIAVANDSLALFVEAFAMLVLAKTYQIAKAAVVPSTVLDEHELVEANSKLQLLSGVAAVTAGGVGGVLLQIDPVAVAGLMVLVFIAATVAGLGIHPLERRPIAPEGADGRPGAEPSLSAGVTVEELASGSVLVAGYVMALIRMIVGFVTLSLAFELRGEAERLSPVDFAVNTTVRIIARNPFSKVHSLVEGPPPSWYFGAVIGISVIAGILGAAVAPRLRRVTTEPRILAGACVVIALAAVVGATSAGVLGYLTLAGGVSAAAALGKQAFDSLTQRETPDAALGRVFSRYEARFQIVWVLGALLPSIVHAPIEVGAVPVLVTAVIATVVMISGVRPRPVRAAMETRAGREAMDRLPAALRRRDPGSPGSRDPS